MTEQIRTMQVVTQIIISLPHCIIRIKFKSDIMIFTKYKAGMAVVYQVMCYTGCPRKKKKKKLYTFITLKFRSLLTYANFINILYGKPN